MNMDKYEAVLFDLGGTLIYFDGDWPKVLPDLNRALLASLQAAGLELHESGFIEHYDTRMRAYYAQRDTEFLEYTTAFVVRTTLEEMGFYSVSEDMIRDAVRAMYAISQSHWKVETDAIPTLEKLRHRGYRLGLVSNASDDQDVQTLVDKAGVRPYLEVVLTSAAQGIRKPNPHIFYAALQAMGGIQPEKAAMIGDTLGADILGARNAGLFSIWIRRRADSAANRSHEDTILPDRTVDSLSDLVEIFP